jgi:hypothetical protein
LTGEGSSKAYDVRLYNSAKTQLKKPTALARRTAGAWAAAAPVNMGTPGPVAEPAGGAAGGEAGGAAGTGTVEVNCSVEVTVVVLVLLLPVG